MTTAQTATHTEHCSSCGSTDPENLRGGYGYTACCNKRVCSGNGSDRYGTPTNFRWACCWAKATIAFGGDENVPDRASRLI